VRQVVEGSGGEPGRPVRYWEFCTEPECPYFWDKAFEPVPADPLGLWLRTAMLTLVELHRYRESSPAASDLRFGLGSFAGAETAVTVLRAFDSQPLPDGSHLPLDFLSFHAYSNDPLEIVEKVRAVAAVRDASGHYRGTEVVLAEWGPSLDGVGWSAQSMDVPLLVSTVIALGAAAGLDRSHHAIFWDYFPAIRYGLLDHELRPKPLYHAYTLLSAVIGVGAERLAPEGFEDGRLDGGDGAVLASRDPEGRLRVLLVNRGAVARTARIDLGTSPGAVPRAVRLFADHTRPPQQVVASRVVTVPPRAMLLLEL